MTTVNTTPPVPPLPQANSTTAKANSGAATNEAVATATTKAATVVTGSTIATISPTADVQPFSKVKVDAIIKAIEKGEFRINVENIADKLIQEMILKPENPTE